MSKDKLDNRIDEALTRFFYGRIIQSLEVAMDALIEEENYEGASIVRDEIKNIEESLKKELHEDISSVIVKLLLIFIFIFFF